jgi:hypothetical protein
MVCEGFLTEAALRSQLSHPFPQRQHYLLHRRKSGDTI